MDHIVVLPASLLKRGERIRDDDLPFDIELLSYYQNSSLVARQEAGNNLATAGIGLKADVEELPPATGVDETSSVDVPSAYVTLYKKGTDQPLDTYLVSVLLGMQDMHDTVDVDGKPYDIALRFKRSYRDFSVYLDDVRAESYIGTATPRDYSSYIHLVAPKQGIDRDIRIWMNNPLRFGGETFYQSGYSPAAPGQRETTTLQVVSNTGWMIPYVSCMIVGTGLLAQFGLSLLRFLRRRDQADPEAEAEPFTAEVGEDAYLTRAQRAKRVAGATPPTTTSSARNPRPLRAIGWPSPSRRRSR